MMLLPLQSVPEEILSDQHFYIVRLNLCLQNKIHSKLLVSKEILNYTKWNKNLHYASRELLSEAKTSHLNHNYLSRVLDIAP